MSDFSGYTAPAWMNAAHTQIDINRPDGVRTTITPNAPDPELWAAVVAGQRGPIAAYIAPAPSQDLLRRHANLVCERTLGASRVYSSSGGSIHCDATTATRADLQQLMAWGAANPDAEQDFIANDHSIWTVTGAGFVALAPQVGAYALSVYSALSTVLKAITEGAITTLAQIDNFEWPT